MSEPTPAPPAAHSPLWRRVAVPFLAVALLAVIVLGVATATSPSTDRAEALAARLRCPVCQSVSVGESRSETALAMQQRIRELVAAGASDEEVIGYFVDRYGQWVLLDPPVSGPALALWLLPIVAAGVGLFAVQRLRRREPADPAPPAPWRHRIEQEVERLRTSEEGREPW
ncbi:MAG: cytochrome c-type biogenesis protein CcmH [Actinomycetes bacterium]